MHRLTRKMRGEKLERGGQWSARDMPPMVANPAPERLGKQDPLEGSTGHTIQLIVLASRTLNHVGEGDVHIPFRVCRPAGACFTRPKKAGKSVGASKSPCGHALTA